MTDTPILLQTFPTESGGFIAQATLNAEKKLNALSLEMIDILLPQLKAWQADKNIHCVVLNGTGEKAFCAGGDVKQVTEEKVSLDTLKTSKAFEFFTKEYQLDYLIHTYQKPIIVWGHGIVMGGGMGLLAGASHRVMTENTHWAMPEITIGLYPDVGSTYFLSRVSKGAGLFMGLTGAAGNAADALFMNLADYYVGQDQFPALLQGLIQADWANNADNIAHQVISGLIKPELPESPVWKNYFLIQQLTEGKNIQLISEKILNYTAQDPWLIKAQKNLLTGCPTTAHIVYQQLKRGRRLSLSECFQLELTLTMNCVLKGEFAEGVRALLIDRDKNPRWRYSDIASVPQNEIDQYFQAPWQGEHPLKDLQHII